MAEATSRERTRRYREREARKTLGDESIDVESLPEPPSRELLLRILGQKARNGETQAIKLLLEEQRRDRLEAEAAQNADRSAIDELAARRVA